MDSPEDEHIIEAIGKCRIVVRNGQVVEVGPSLISKCPLAERFAKPGVRDHSWCSERELGKPDPGIRDVHRSAPGDGKGRVRRIRRL